jgi:aminoglycoside phosphotransferase (APT) family kinase protein
MDNLMFHPREPRILGVLDWELSTLGHPLADFSYHCMSWNVAHGPGSRGIGGLDIAGLGIPSERQYIDRYCALTGFATSADLLTNWNFYLAYNMFRMAAILQGIAVRAESGTAANPVTATGADRMARLGWSFAQRA